MLLGLVSIDEQVIQYIFFSICQANQTNMVWSRFLLVTVTWVIIITATMPYTGHEGDKRRVGIARRVVSTLWSTWLADNCFTGTLPHLRMISFENQLHSWELWEKNNQIFPNDRNIWLCFLRYSQTRVISGCFFSHWKRARNRFKFAWV